MTIRYLYLLLFIVANRGAFAQLEVRLNYYNSEWERCEKGDAVYYQSVTFQDNRYYMKEGYVNGRLLFEGQFLDYALTESQDTFITYYPNGIIKEKGAYRAGKKVGVWLGWFENGSKDYKCSYKADSTSKCAYYHSNGMLSAIEEYKNDTQLLSGTLWDSSGVISANQYLETSPTFNGYSDGWKNYFAEHMVFPYDELGNKIQGNARFYILVDKQGNVSWGGVMGFANPHMVLAIKRVVDKMPKWAPAIVHNRPTETRLELNFSFN